MLNAKRVSFLLLGILLLLTAWLLSSKDQEGSDPGVLGPSVSNSAAADEYLQGIADGKAVRKKLDPQTVTLRVRNAHDLTGIAGANISLLENNITPVGESDDRGLWTNETTLSGVLHLLVEADGYLPVELDLDTAVAGETDCLMIRAGVLTVRCNGQSGRALRGCKVILNSASRGGLRRSSTTRIDGVLQFSDLPCGVPIRVNCQRRGQLKVGSLQISPATGRAELQFELTEADASVTGLLLWDDETPVTGYGKIVKISSQGIRRASRVQPDGRFAIDGLPVGECYLRVDLPTHTARSLQLEEGMNDIGVVQVERLGKVRGELVGTANPGDYLIEVLVESRVVISTKISDVGDFEVEAPIGEIELAVRRDGSPYRHWLVRTPTLCPATRVRLDVSVALGSITWAMANAEVPQQLIAISAEMNVLGISPGISNSWNQTLPTELLPDGSWRAGPLPHGRYDIFVDCGAQAGSWHRSVEVGSDDAVSLGALNPGMGTLTLELDPETTPDGPIPASVISGLHKTTPIFAGRATKVLPGPWQLAVETPGAGRTSLPYFDVHAGSQQTIRWLEEGLGSVSGIANGAAGQAEQLSLRLRPLLSYKRAIKRDLATPDATGRFQFDGVLPGSYLVTCEIADCTLRAPVEVIAGQSAKVVIELPSAPGASCLVESSEGKPWRNGRHAVAITPSGICLSARIQPGGRFRLPLPAGDIHAILVSRDVPSREVGAPLAELYSLATLIPGNGLDLVVRQRSGSFTLQARPRFHLLCYLKSVDGVSVQSPTGFDYPLEGMRSRPGHLQVQVPPDGIEVFLREIDQAGDVTLLQPFLATDRDFR